VQGVGVILIDGKTVSTFTNKTRPGSLVVRVTQQDAATMHTIMLRFYYA
jgi:hypothetical protein